MGIYVSHYERGDVSLYIVKNITSYKLTYYNPHNPCGIRFAYKFTKDVIYGRYLSNKFVIIQKKQRRTN